MKYDFSANDEQFLKNLVTFNKNRSKNIKIVPTKVCVLHLTSIAADRRAQSQEGDELRGRAEVRVPHRDLQRRPEKEGDLRKTAEGKD